MARNRAETVVTLANVLPCAGAVIALAAGAPARRLLPVAVFGGLGVAVVACANIVLAVQDRRARSQEAWVPPRDVTLTKPLWMSALEPVGVTGLVTPVAALAAAVGFPGVGVGVLVTACLFLVGLALAPTTLARTLAFAADGLRVQVRRATFLIRWDAITEVTRAGPGGLLVIVRFKDPRAVLASVVPHTERARAQVRLFLGGGEAATGEVTFESWTAGLDPVTLARALVASIAPSPGRTN